MRRFLLLISLSFILAAASQRYSVVITGPFKDALYDITEDYDGQITAVGFSQHFSPAPAASKTYTSAFDYLADHNRANGEQIRLIRLNSEGATTLDRSLNLPEFNRAISVIKTPSNGYLVGGYTQDGQLLAAKLDANGAILFLHRFGTRNYDRIQRLVPLRDGGALAVGSSVTSRSDSDALFQQGLGQNDIYLTRFSKSGKLRWSKKYGTDLDDRGIDAAEAQDGTLVIMGNTDRNATRELVLMRLSENGDKIWRQSFSGSGYTNGYDLISRDDGYFTASLTERQNHKETIRLLTFDLQRNIIADRNVTSDKECALYRIMEKSDGTLVGVGYATDPTSGNTDALAMRFAHNGTQLWKKEYGGKHRALFRSVALLRDGKLAAAGERVMPGNEAPDMWIVKLNDDGSFAMRSSGPGTRSLYDRLKTLFADDIEKGNITLTKDLTITLTHPTLLFKPGVYRLTPVQQTFLDRFSPKLLNTLEPYRSRITALRINGHTSSEWRGADTTERYLNNTELSTQRAYSVLSHIFRYPKNRPHRQWLTDVLSNDGYSYAKLVKSPEEDRVASRRVAFQILLK